MQARVREGSPGVRHR